MAYADFDYYSDSFGGSLIPAEEFPYLAERAADFINYITLGYAKTVEDENIARACCACADEIKRLDEMGDISSQSVGQFSVSYNSKSGGEDKRTRLYRTAETYLAETGLLYAGISILQ